MTEAHRVITVFLLQRNEGIADNNTYLWLSDNSEIWVGDDNDNFSASFTKVFGPIFSSGFSHITDPESG